METKYFLEIYSGKKLISRKKLENLSKPQREDELERVTNLFLLTREIRTVKLKRSKKELSEV